MDNINKAKKVVVGMSSGIDSSVAAFLLASKGYKVTGVYLKFWKNENKSSEEEKKAKLIAKHIGIDFYVVDARKLFKQKVIGYFLREYAAGRTPNPCVFCNENVKFKLLFQAMKKKRADYVATGHYAAVKKNGGRYALSQGKDTGKDQSYFLYRLKQNELRNVMFPLEDLTKKEVRLLAKKARLPVEANVESQDICFLGGLSAEEFLHKNLRPKPGKILDLAGNIVGRHKGLPLYTVGQRKGLNIGGVGPYYVTGRDFRKNIILASNDKKELSLFSRTACLKQLHWIGQEPAFPAKLQMRTRYHNPLIYGTIEDSSVKKVTFDKPQRAVASGQSVVFYSKNGEVLGGGIVK